MQRALAPANRRENCGSKKLQIEQIRGKGGALPKLLQINDLFANYRIFSQTRDSPTAQMYRATFLKLVSVTGNLLIRLVALTGIEPDGWQFRRVQMGLSSCVFSLVGIPGCSETQL